MESGCSVADGARLYTLDHVKLGKNVTIAHEAFVCTGTHDLHDPVTPLITAPIVIEDEVFVGARAFILPGVRLGAGSVIGAMSVVTADTEPWTIYAGNPARPIGRRTMHVAQD